MTNKQVSIVAAVILVAVFHNTHSGRPTTKELLESAFKLAEEIYQWLNKLNGQANPSSISISKQGDN